MALKDPAESAADVTTSVVASTPPTRTRRAQKSRDANVISGRHLVAKALDQVAVGAL